MKLFVVFVLLTLNYSFGQTGINTSNDILAFNERIAQAIIDGDRELNIDDYLSKDDLKVFIKSIPDSMNADSILTHQLDTYDEKLQQFRNFYASSFSAKGLQMYGLGDVNWNNCTIDSSSYMIIVLDPTKRNQKIYWPASKRYKLNSDIMVATRGVVYISEGDKNYLVEIDSICFNKMQKFYHSLRSPSIVRVE